MIRVESDITFERSPEEVFDFVAGPAAPGCAGYGISGAG